MSYVVRKINRAKWPSTEIKVGDISSDAITQCLYTKQNTISFWEIESEDYLIDAVLAIVSQFKHLDTIDVVMLEKEQIDKSEINYESTEGVTLLEEFKDNHIDLIELNYSKLGKLAELISINILNDRYERLTKGDLKRILSKAIQKGRLSKDELYDDVAKYF